MKLRHLTLLLAVALFGALLHSGVQAGDKDKKDDPKEQPKEQPKETVIDAELTNADLKDRVLTESFHKPYVYKMKKGHTYQIDLISRAFDAYLRLENPKGDQVAANDDGGGMLNSRITYRAPEDGDYMILAMSLGGGSTGKFTLKVKELTPAAPVNAKGFDLKLDKGQVAAASMIAANDPAYKGKRHKAFTLHVEAGKTYQIDMISMAFDPYLFLENPDGEVIAQDDDGGEGLNSRITFKAAKAGKHRIICTYFGNGDGEFNLTVRQTDEKDGKQNDAKDGAK
jgi:hypothetical protein